jgi:hypothetical protein
MPAGDARWLEWLARYCTTVSVRFTLEVEPFGAVAVTTSG